jgi:Fe2+ transport system protein B
MDNSSLEKLLQERSDEFKVKILEFVKRYSINETDPFFISLIDGLMGETPTSQMNSQWHSLQKDWAITAVESATAAKQLTQAIQTLEKTSFAEQAAIKAQAESQTRLIVTFYQEQTNLLQAETKKLAAQAVESAQASAAEQVTVISQRLRKAYLLEAIGYACFGAALLFATGWTFGWFGHGLRDSKSMWADFARWNEDEVQACFEAGKNTCNIHIEVPEK